MSPFRRGLRPLATTIAAAPTSGASTLNGVYAAPPGVLRPDYVMDFDGEDLWFNQLGANTAGLATATDKQDPTTEHDGHFQCMSAVENDTLYAGSLPGDAGLSELSPAPAPPSALLPPISGDTAAGRAALCQPDFGSVGPENCFVQLARLSAVLFAMPPNSNVKQTRQRGLWIVLVPPLVAHMKTIQGILARAATVTAAASETPSEDGSESGKAEPFVVDSPTWLLQLSCFTRVIQICRLVLASLRRSLESNSDVLGEMSLEGTMLQADEPGLKIFVLVQVLSYRIDALAAAMNLPERHSVRRGAPASSASTRSTSPLALPSGTTDSILEGRPTERSVFGSADERKETILEAFRTECKALIALAD